MKFSGKKVLAVGLAATMVMSLLTGCVGEIANTTIKADGSGTMEAKVGFTKAVMDLMGESMNSQGYYDDYDTFTYNGVTYYGEVESTTFASIAELNDLFENFSEDGEVETGTFKFTKDSAGNITMTVNVDGDTTSSTSDEMNAEDLGISEAELKAMTDEMAIVFSFTFPNQVYQIAGETGGVTINGNTVTLDFVAMSADLTAKNISSTKYVISTDKNSTGSTQMFEDVQPGQWYYNAVNAMAEGGLVNGVGNNKFDPNGTLTIAQFCQILARAKGMETGADANGYWAGKAIQSCLNAKYIESFGTVNSANYDKAISREAAVAAMYRAKASSLGEKKYNIYMSDIPDSDKISSVYIVDILNAYDYGITTGTDSNRTFNPKGNLTRAQVCQLFYNLDWTSPAK